jgi:hypothetical protein
MSEIYTKASTQGGQAGSLPICHDRLRPLPVRRGDYVRKLRGVANHRVPRKVHQERLCTKNCRLGRRIPDANRYVPFSSSFLVLRLNCFHHEAKSRFEGGELEPGSGEVGSGTGSAPECDLLTVTMANPGTGMCFEDVEDSGRLGHRLGNGAGPKKARIAITERENEEQRRAGESGQVKGYGGEGMRKGKVSGFRKGHEPGEP